MWQPRRVGRWVLLGITASIVELALLRALYEGLHWPLPLATAIAAEVLIIGKFLANDRIVFELRLAESAPTPALPRRLRRRVGRLRARPQRTEPGRGRALRGGVCRRHRRRLRLEPRNQFPVGLGAA